MKTNTLKRHALLLFLLGTLMGTQAFAQPYPPAQGPPLPPTPASELGTFLLINNVEIALKTTVDSANARIKRDEPNTGVSARVSFSMETFQPGMSFTTYEDQPNQNVVRIAFIVKYHIDNIKYKGIPYFDRNINQSIQMFVACKDWFTNDGRLNVSANIEQPYLDNASFGEQVLNFFIANTLTNLVDSKLRATLPDAMRTSNQIMTAPCNCLGVNSGTKAQKYKDGAILFALKKLNRPRPIGIGATAFSTATVRFLNIKRLNARSVPDNQILYADAENIQLTLYVNHTLRAAEVNNIREGEERPLHIESVSIPRPGDNDMLILIGNVEQLSFNSALKDSRYAVYRKAENFGNGVQKLVVTKSYWTKPQRLPGGGTTKPQQVKVPAYEITYQIEMPYIPNIIVRN
ncbi:MAG: hypothetical protein ACK4TA_17400 [Saprospiraceae bacterium]